MTFMEAVTTVLRTKYANFSDRAPRSEFWWYSLFSILVSILLYVLFLGLGGASWVMSFASGGEMDTLGVLPKIILIIGLLFMLATLIPNIAVVVRRFHDRNLSGWWYLGLIVLSMIPFVNFVVAIGLIVLLCLKGTNGDNKYGPDPLV